MQKTFRYPLKHKLFQQAVENDSNIDNNEMSMTTFSQTGQDLFVVAMLEGKSKGTYLELGCNQPKWSNNTFVLEKFFLFSGVSIDIDYDEHSQFNSHLDITERSWPLCRPSTTYYKQDALTFDYSSLHNYYDYLQVDIEPPTANLTALQTVCSKKQFAVITFEHDSWNKKSAQSNIKEQSRNFLTSLGYTLIVNDIGVGSQGKLVSYEDWWAHPDYVSPEVIHAYQQIDFNRVITWQDVLFDYK